MNGEHPTGFWSCSSAQTKMKRKFSGRMRSRKNFVRTWSMRSSCWRTSTETVIVRFRTLLRTGEREKQGTYDERFGKLQCIGQLLCRGGGPFKVIRPKMSEDHSEVPREGADDLTLRADTQKACINVDHIGARRGTHAGSASRRRRASRGTHGTRAKAEEKLTG